PNITLIEVDHDKGLRGGGNRKDRKLFFKRFKNAFNGRSSSNKLEKIASDYGVRKILNSKKITRSKEARIGDCPKHEVLKRIQNRLNPKFYLEIGVQTGKSLVLAPQKAIGVDPKPQLKYQLPERIEIVSLKSDDFFEEGLDKWTNLKPDLAF